MNESEEVFKIAIRIRYAETDGMGIVHHGVHPIWLEQARCDWLAEKGLPYQSLEAKGWHIPVLTLHVEYDKSLKFGDDVFIEVRYEKLSGIKFRFHYLIFREDQKIGSAYTEHLFLQDNKPRRIPDFFKRSME